MSKYPFKNLALKGGGIRGIAYLGALEVLADPSNDILGNLESISGSSAGAITALVTAMYPNDFQKIKDTANTMDFKKVAFKQGLIHNLEDLVTKKGLHSTEYIYTWFQGILKEKFGNPNITFAEFNSHPDTLKLNIMVTNISSQLSIVCNAKTTPNHQVADIVRTSMSIPVYFESNSFDDDSLKGYFGDGGTMCNYPIAIWDNDSGPNDATLGLFLYAKEGVQQMPQKYKLKEYAGDTIFSLLIAQDWGIGMDSDDLRRSIQIFDNGVKPTAFDVTVGDDIYNGLYENGKKAAQEYLADYDAKNWDKLSTSKFSTPMDSLTGVGE